MKVSLEGLGEQVATFEAETEGAAAVKAGGLVTMSGNGKVRACTEAGDIPAGVALSLRNGFAAVQVKGYVQVPCDSSVTVGWQAVASDASGALTVPGSGGRQALVTDVEDGRCGIVL